MIMERKNWFFKPAMASAILAAAILSSCGGEASRTTGHEYNNEDYGGFEKVAYTEQEPGPGLVFIEGGSFMMGRTADDNVIFEWDNEPRKVSVSSFYLDETEVTNFAWTEYLYWLNRVYGADYKEVFVNALPDTLAWRDKLAYNENYVKYYLRHPAYRDYPVVGVSWLQANDFCRWRTDRVNEQILISQGLFEQNNTQVNDDNFSTDAYYAGKYESGKSEEGVRNYAPEAEFRNVRIEDGMLLPEYRLPTEAEWEYAAYGLIGESFEERIENRKIYPWSGNFIRNDRRTGNYLGDIRDNFVRGRGDYMGVAGSLNDGADITAPVYKYQPNDYGLYSMAGNVSEWVMDVYRPLTSEDANEHRAFRGNVYRTPVLNAEGVMDEKLDKATYDVYGFAQYVSFYKDSVYAVKANKIPNEEAMLEDLVTAATEAIDFYEKNQVDAANERLQEAVENVKGVDEDVLIAPIVLDGIGDFITNIPGQQKYRNVTEEENLRRINYKRADNIDYLDGDLYSATEYSSPNDYTAEEEQRGIPAYRDGVNTSVYNYEKSSLINNRMRVYKGGSWSDRAYYCSPSTRRYLDERMASSKIGFRCAMDRMGGPTSEIGNKGKRN